MDDEVLHLEDLDLDILKQIPVTLRQSFEQVLREVQESFRLSILTVERDVAQQLTKVEVLQD